MGPAEITALMMFALTFIAAVVGKSMIKGLIAGALGIFASTVGLDPEAATPRMTFGLLELEEGIPLLAMVVGMLALAEIMVQIETHARARAAGHRTEINAFDRNTPREDRIVSGVEFRASFRTIMRSAVIGTVIGAIPGLGSTLAGFLGYGAAKRASKTPDEFGKGALDGIAGAESANSATVGANLIPTLALGIPGNLSAAILLSALIIHGLTPGPLIFQQHGEVLYGLFACMLVANLINLLIGQGGLRLFAWVISLPHRYIHPVIVLLCFSGAYLTTQSMFAVALMVGFGVLGYIMRKLDFSVVAFIIAFILGPLFENALRQTLVLFGDDLSQLLTRPIAIFFLAVTAYSIWRLGFRPKPKILQES
jgi:putative tricarboxylic transport membrane protein